MRTANKASIKIKCPWCPSDQEIMSDKFDEWDMVGNIHDNGDTFADKVCSVCGKPFWIHQKSHDQYTIGKLRVHRLIHH